MRTGARYLEPMVWGKDALVAIMEQINRVAVPGTIGVIGEEVTKSTSFLHLQVAGYSLGLSVWPAEPQLFVPSYGRAASVCSAPLPVAKGEDNEQ
jgi:hypothetical protein